MQMRKHRALSQSGATLIELLLGAATGLAVIVLAVRAFTQHLQHQARSQHEARVQQELRLAGDLIARAVQRSGYWKGAALAIPGGGGSAVNPHAIALSEGALLLSYDGPAAGSGLGGFRLEGQELKANLGPKWPRMSVANEIVFTAFEVQIDRVPPTASECAPYALTEVKFRLSARATAMPEVQREFTRTVWARNPLAQPACAADA
jgi:hypothetical protein